MTDVKLLSPAEAPDRRSGALRQQQPISDYGLIGDMRTAALVGLAVGVVVDRAQRVTHDAHPGSRADLEDVVALAFLGRGRCRHAEGRPVRGWPDGRGTAIR